MRRNISVTNERVIKALEESENASKLIEVAVLRYLDKLEADYVTRDEFNEAQEDYNKKVCILNENYTQSRDLIMNIAKYLKLF